MIKYTEVRIGNIVNKSGQSAPINAGDFLKVDLGAKELKEIKPIPLTPEWLGRCGFKWEKGYMKLSLKDARLSLGFYAGVWDKMSLFQISIPGEGSVETEIGFGSNHPEYLHQLQNLYFALTGEELTIKN